MAHSLQGVYSPLPQSLSDSDSEKEISMEPICSNYNSKRSNFDMNYHQNGHLHIKDEIIKIKRGNPKMSTIRKTAFAFSILLCFLPIIIFLWVLPCSEFSTCPVQIRNWEYQQDDIELKGPINLVHGLYSKNLNLALLYKGSYNNPKPLKNGVISFMGNNGAVAWDFQQETEPLNMNCSLIDVDSNGNNDCLVVDKRGLKAIETISGQALWHAHSAEVKKMVTDLSLPVKLPDFNMDGSNELLSIYKKESLFLICGKTGKALSNVKIPSCTDISDLKLIKDHVRYACKTNGTLGYYELPVNDIKQKYLDSKYVISSKKIEDIKADTFVTTGKRKLQVKNEEECPNCHASITLFDDKNIELRTWAYSNAFIVTPKPFCFDASQANLASLKGHVNGFIIKIWQWADNKKKFSAASTIFKRSVARDNVLNGTYYLSEVTERVILITFNETDVHLINASLTEVNQICYNDFTTEGSFCQPDYKNQDDSLLVTDLDYDGSKELISYSSSYVRRETEESWHLVSYLKVFRLESELPKLYGSK